MSENIKQRYNATTQTTTSNPFRNLDLSDGSPALDGDVIVFGGVCDTTGAAVDFATQTTLAAIAVDAAAIEVLLGTIDTDTGNIATSAASIDTKTPALGQALEAASVPVVLTAAQVSTLTPPAAITGFATAANQLPDGHNVTIDNASIAVTGTFWQATQPVSGTVTADLGATDNAVLDAIASSAAAIQSGQLADGHNVTIDNASIAVTGTFWQATQPVSAASLPLPSGAATSAGQLPDGHNVTIDNASGAAAVNIQDGGNSITVDGTVAVTGTQTDALTDTQLRATAVAVSGTVTAELSATDNAVLDAIAASVAGTLTVGSHAVTNAGTFAVQVAQSGTWTVTGAGGSFPVTDSGGSLTVDAPVGTPVFVRLSDGSSAITTLPVSLASVPSHAVTNAGTFAVQVSSALPAGTNNIGDVDVLSLPSITGTVTANAGTNLNTAALALESGGNLAAAATSLGLLDDAVYAFSGASASKFVGLAAYDDGDTGTMKPLLWDNANGGLHVTLVGALNAVSVVGGITDDATFTPASSTVLMSGFFADETSTDSVNEGDGGAARMTLDRKQIVTPQPHTAGGLSIFRSLDLDESEEEVKATAGQIYGGFITNTSTGTRWIKFYNATAANVTVGTTTPVITWGIQGGATDDVAAVLNLGGMGLAFDTAISVAATTGFADADTGAPGTNDVIVNLFYK